MYKEITIQLKPGDLHREEAHRRGVAHKLGISPSRLTGLKLLRRSIDARKGRVRFVLRFGVWADEDPQSVPPFQFDLPEVSSAPEVHVIGCGPAGLFAALELIRLGLRPILIDRGKPVRERRRDLALLTREGEVNPDSNYCFGEGGAGTFSDGKLYTRSTKRGDIQEVLDILVQFGASEDILIDAHPHIGTNKLPAIIQNIREAISAAGGEIHFNCRLSDLRIEDGRLSAIEVNDQEWWKINQLILATGHSARDVFELLDQKGIPIEAKPFALGVRIEHPQEIVDSIQYSCPRGQKHPNLPAANYALVRQVADRGVYSFCMCPGGIICPAATAPGEIVINGWSPSLRNTGFANSGLVVEVQLQDLPGNQTGPLRAVDYQKEIEQRAFEMGGGKQVAPAQRVQDFVEGKVSHDLPDCSYLPGVKATDLREVLPQTIHDRLTAALTFFGQRMKGYLTNEAVLVAPESRTSSPIRIPRDRESLQHPQVSRLYPCGEGAGYAGGIMSAALDGQRVARAVARMVKAT